jgi:hypothetical protein
MRRKVLGLLALAAGWTVLVADGGLESCPDFDVQYEFQTNCMGEPASGSLNLAGGGSCLPAADGYYYDDLGIPELDKARAQGLNVQNVTALFKGPEKKRIAIGFDFSIIGEPVSKRKPVYTGDAPGEQEATVPLFVCKDSRTHETIAVDKDYLCEAQDNPSQTCELKLLLQPRE